jgi:hypothetical protein
MKINITWEVEDGYCGKSRPHNTVFDSEDYFKSEEEWNDLSEDEKNEYIHEYVQEEFENRISWCIINKKETD